MKPLEHLKKLIIEKHKKQHPSFPEHLIPVNTFGTAKPETRELKRIVTFLNNIGGATAQIVVNTGRRVDNRKTYTDSVGFSKTIGSVEFRKSTVRNGTADIRSIINGKPVEIELKRIYKKGKDRQSEAQKQYQKDVEEAGGIYMIVTSFEDFYEKYFDI